MIINYQQKEQRETKERTPKINTPISETHFIHSQPNTPISETRFMHSHYINIDATKRKTNLSISRTPAYVRGWKAYIKDLDFERNPHPHSLL